MAVVTSYATQIIKESFWQKPCAVDQEDFKFVICYRHMADLLRYTLFGMFGSTLKRLVNILQRVEDDAVYPFNKF